MMRKYKKEEKKNFLVIFNFLWGGNFQKAFKIKFISTNITSKISSYALRHRKYSKAFSRKIQNDEGL